MIELESATKRYGSFLAVEDVSFRVEPGQIVAFVGPNGAGKSTCLKMLSTFLTPDGGKVSVGGMDAARDPLSVRRVIGYMPENNILYEGMRVDRFLSFIGQAHGLKGARLKSRIEWVVENCHIESVISKRIYQCSKGYHRRVSLAMALIHDPSALLFDEPTHGLDPLQVLALREFIVSLKPGKAILFSSHIFQEVIAICDRILIINNGRLLANGSLESIARKAGVWPGLSVVTEGPHREARRAFEKLTKGRAAHFSETGPNSSAVEVAPTADGAREEAERAARAAGLKVLSMMERPLDLEYLFADIVRRHDRERGGKE